MKISRLLMVRVTILIATCVAWTARAGDVGSYHDAIGVNLSRGTTNDILPTTSEGHVPQLNWNNAQGGTTAGLTTNVTHNGVAVTGLTVSYGTGWSGAWGYAWTYHSTPPSAPGQDLVSGLGDTGWYMAYNPTMTVGGIPFSSYDVAVLTSAYPNNDYYGTPAVQAMTWNVLTGLSGPSYTFSMQSGSIYAMQILDTTPEADPTLEIASVSMVASDVVLGWQGSTSWYYTVEHALYLSPEEWTNLPGYVSVTPASNDMMFASDTNNVSAQGFYRVKMSQTP